MVSCASVDALTPTTLRSYQTKEPMTLKPKLAIRDLQSYLRLRGFGISDRAKKVFLEAEEISFQYDTTLLCECVLLALVNSSPRFQGSLVASGSDLSLIAPLIHQYIRENRTNAYHKDGLAPYSNGQSSRDRKRFIDRCVDKGRRDSRDQIVETDLLEVLIELPEDLAAPLLSTKDKDKSYITPRRQINLALFLTGTVPPHIRGSVFRFRKDNPDYEKNCFLVMSFSSSALHKRIYKVLKATLSDLKLNLLRADDKPYAPDLLSNIETYIYGCSFAIAAFERIQNDAHNPNVAFEVGYLDGLKKPVCFLKEETVSTLFTDLIGRLCCKFDIQDVETTLPPQVEKWLRDNRII